MRALQYYLRESFWETDPRKKRDLLKKAVADGASTIELVESTGYPLIITYARATKGVEMFHSDLIYFRTNVKALEKIFQAEKKSLARKTHSNRELIKNR